MSVPLHAATITGVKTMASETGRRYVPRGAASPSYQTCFRPLQTHSQRAPHDPFCSVHSVRHSPSSQCNESKRDAQSEHLGLIPRLNVKSLALSRITSYDTEICTCDRKDRSPVFCVRVERSLGGARCWFYERGHWMGLASSVGDA